MTTTTKLSVNHPQVTQKVKNFKLHFYIFGLSHILCRKKLLFFFMWEITSLRQWCFWDKLSNPEFHIQRSSQISWLPLMNNTKLDTGSLVIKPQTSYIAYVTILRLMPHRVKVDILLTYQVLSSDWHRKNTILSF